MKKFLFLVITILCFCGAIFCAACEPLTNTEGKGEGNVTQDPLPQENPSENTPSQEESAPEEQSQDPVPPQGEGEEQKPSEGEEPQEQACSHNFSNWEEVLPTCTKEGERKRVCTLCGAEEKETLPALGHNFSDPAPENKQEPTCTEEGIQILHCQNEGCDETKEVVLEPNGHFFSIPEIISEPTCEGKGEQTRKCNICGYSVKEEIPASGHKFETKREEPTCAKEGKEEKKCTVCGKSESKTLPALEHTYGEERVTAEPTCVDAGEKVQECSLCGNIKKTPIPALGHDFSDTFTIDEVPTKDRPGSRSKHCLRVGCNARTAVETLDMNTTLTYSVKVMRTNGAPVEDLKSKPRIFIMDGSNSLKGGTGTYISADLPIGEYTAKIENVPSGFTVDSDRITLTPEARECVFYLKVNLTKPTYGQSYTYSSVGSVLHDHSIFIVGSTSQENKTVTVSSLLAEYKAIFINCYFIGCDPCRREIDDMIKAYNEIDSLGNKYGDDVAMIMITLFDLESEVRDFKNNPRSYFTTTAQTLPFMMAVQYDFINDLTSGQFPTSYIVDCEGVVTFKTIGGLSKAEFTSAMEEHGLKYYKNLHQTKGNIGASICAMPEIILPTKFTVVE